MNEVEWEYNKFMAELKIKDPIAWVELKRMEEIDAELDEREKK